jgi:hypothetical protein
LGHGGQERQDEDVSGYHGRGGAGRYGTVVTKEEGTLSTQPTYSNRGAVQPLACFSEGWRLIRDQYPLMMGISLVGVIIAGSVPFGLLQGPMMCGIYLCLFALERGERLEFATLFKGFDYFLPSLIATLVHMVPMLLVFIPASLAWFFLFFLSVGTGMPGEARSVEPAVVSSLVLGTVLVGLLLFLLFVAFSALLIFAYPLIVDQRLSGWDACRTSARAVLGNVGGVLVLLLLNVVLSVAGLLLCYVGVVLVLPIGFAAMAAAYRRVFPESA